MLSDLHLTSSAMYSRSCYLFSYSSPSCSGSFTTMLGVGGWVTVFSPSSSDWKLFCSVRSRVWVGLPGFPAERMFSPSSPALMSFPQSPVLLVIFHWHPLEAFRDEVSVGVGCPCVSGSQEFYYLKIAFSRL